MSTSPIDTETVFSSLRGERHLFLFEEVTDDIASKISSQMLFLDKKKKEDITIIINSNGGSMYAKNAIYDMMQYVRSDIRTIVIGRAISAAALILTAGERGKRFALPNSWIMLHQTSTHASWQKTTDMTVVADQAKREQKKSYGLLSAHTRQPISRIRKDLKKDFWLSPEEAVKYGLIDEVLYNLSPKPVKNE